MPDIRHAALEFPACPLAREIDRCPDPDPFGDAKGLLQNPLEQRLNFRKPFAEARKRVWRHAFRHEQRRGCRCHHSSRQFLARHHRPKKTDLIGVERHAERRDRIERKHPPESLRLHQQHPRGDDTAGRMGGEMAEPDI